MRSRAAVAFLLVLALPALSGCLTGFGKDKGDDRAVAPPDVGYDPSLIRVTGVQRHEAMVPSFDGTPLAVVAYEPMTGDLTPDGLPPRWGTVLFAHGWGFFKETYEGAPGTLAGQGVPVPEEAAGGAEAAPYGTNRLQAFAEAGLVAVAWDARGFGRSMGQSSIAGPAELQDLEAVRAWAEAMFPSNGLFGALGVSYGGGQSYQAWADNPRITTAVPMYGWVDLYDGLLPGNVPKAEWAALLAGVGVGGSQGKVNPLLASWYQKAVPRTDLETVEAEMTARSVTGRMAGVAKPLFACQGLQESLFPQVDRAWQEATAAFVRAYVFTGGHGTQDDGCWARALDWMRFFVGGHDTGVDGWPALATVDAAGGRAVDYATFPVGVATTYYLDGENLERGFPNGNTFTVSQSLVNNPFQEPAGLWDQVGQPFNQVPYPLRRDPTALFFETQPLPAAEVLLGAATLDLVLAEGTSLPFQVTAQLIHVNAEDESRILARAAYAALDDGDVANGTVTLRFDWAKADLAADDRLVLKLGGNDSSWYLPLLQDYEATFTGASELHVPYFQG